MPLGAHSTPATPPDNAPQLKASARGASRDHKQNWKGKDITNSASGVWWWSPSVSKKLTDMLANELKSSGNFTLVERQSINKVLSEQNWQN